MAWWRSGAPRDDDEPSEPPTDEWARSPWNRGSPLPGPDVLSSERSRPRPQPRPRSQPRPRPKAPRRASEKSAKALRDHKTLLIASAGAVIGALIGGAIIHGNDQKSAEALRRDTVNLTARVPDDAIDKTGANQPWVLRLIVTNSGETNIAIKGAHLADNRFQSSLHNISVDTKIRAGQESWISLDVTRSCDHGAPAPSPQDVDLRVVPEGRPARDVQVRLADDGARITDAAYQNCLSPTTDVWTSAELAGTARAAGKAIDVPVRIHFVEAGAAAVQKLETITAGLAMTATPLPAAVHDDISATIILRWRVTNCAAAKSLAYAAFGMTTTITLIKVGKPLLTQAVLDADAILAIVRFITATCR